MTGKQDRRKVNASLVLSAFALVVSLTGTGAIAARSLITSQQIKNGTIRSADLHANAVRSDDIKNGAVGSGELATNSVRSSDIAAGSVTASDIGSGQITSAAIGTGEVTPQDITVPEPTQIRIAAGATPPVYVSLAYEQAAVIGEYEKQDATTQLQVSWTGSATKGFGSCVFQLRVDGQPSQQSAGEVYVGDTTSVSATALFDGLDIGAHTIEVWARSTNDGSGTPEGGYPCTVGPAQAMIGQTFVIAEQLA